MECKSPIHLLVNTELKEGTEMTIKTFISLVVLNISLCKLLNHYDLPPFILLNNVNILSNIIYKQGGN